jgi:hypothetical protein
VLSQWVVAKARLPILFAKPKSTTSKLINTRERICVSSSPIVRSILEDRASRTGGISWGTLLHRGPQASSIRRNLGYDVLGGGLFGSGLKMPRERLEAAREKDAPARGSNIGEHHYIFIGILLS